MLKTLLEYIKIGGTKSLKEEHFADSNLDGAVYTILRSPRLKYGKFKTTLTRIRIQYSGEKEVFFPFIKEHYKDIHVRLSR